MFKKLIHFKPLFIKQCMHKKERSEEADIPPVSLLLAGSSSPRANAVSGCERQRHRPQPATKTWANQVEWTGHRMADLHDLQRSNGDTGKVSSGLYSFWTISSWRHTPRHSASAMYKWQSWEREKMSKYIFLLSLNLVSNPLKCCGKCRAVTTK